MGTPCSDRTPGPWPSLAKSPPPPSAWPPLQFQVFLKQINSSLVDSNMLVRCVTLSLDRFENQVDMKGKKRLNADVSQSHCGCTGIKHPASCKETEISERHYTKHLHGWGQGSGALGDFHDFSLSSMLPLMGMCDILIKLFFFKKKKRHCCQQNAKTAHTLPFLAWNCLDEKDSSGEAWGGTGPEWD